MLRLDKVQFAYEDVAFEFDMAVEAGALVGVVGPSGAGKSTVLSLIAGFAEPTGGSISWNGVRLNDVPASQRPVSMIFQEHNLFAHLDVFTNVGLGLSPTLKLGEDDKRELTQALAQVGLSGFEQRYPDQLSGGERQRVAIARALVRERPILLLDEPFAALGPALRQQMLELVARLRREKNLTVVLVSHHPAELENIASHMAFVNAGKITVFAESAEFFAISGNQALTDYQGS